LLSEVIQGSGFSAEVVRTDRRKTVAIKVHSGKVSIVVPKSTSTAKIEALVERKAEWIREKLRLQEQYQPLKPKAYVSGESFPYLGRNYRLRVETGPTGRATLNNGSLVVQVPATVRKQAQYIRKAIVEWYRDCATEKLYEKVEQYARIVGVTPLSVAIKTYKARWGSCSRKGDIRFNWKLIMAPDRIVDYVVVHELCHIHHHNHSPQYWQCVEGVFPDFRVCKNWLKHHGGDLQL